MAAVAAEVEAPVLRESVAAKVAVHGLKAVEYTSRYHVGVGTRRG